MQCFVEKEDKSLIDVENVETAGETKVLPSELTNTIEQFIVYVDRNESHYTYIYVYHTNVFEADNIYTQKLPQMSFHLFFFAILFLFDSADCWGAPRPPATRDRFKRVHD